MKNVKLYRTQYDKMQNINQDTIYEKTPGNYVFQEKYYT